MLSYLIQILHSVTNMDKISQNMLVTLLYVLMEACDVLFQNC